jgi:arylsulfatase A-like enzyme
LDPNHQVPGAANKSDAQITMAMVTALDDLVGNVTDTLKHHSLWGDTLVVSGALADNA